MYSTYRRLHPSSGPVYAQLTFAILNARVFNVTQGATAYLWALILKSHFSVHPLYRQRKRNQQLSSACEDTTRATCQMAVSSNHFFIAQPPSDLFFVSTVLKKERYCGRAVGQVGTREPYFSQVPGAKRDAPQQLVAGFDPTPPYDFRDVILFAEFIVNFILLLPKIK